MKYIKILLLMAIWSFGILCHAQKNTTEIDPALADFAYNQLPFKLNGAQKKNATLMFRSSVLTGYREGVKPIQGTMGVNFQRFDDLSTGTARIAMFNLSIQDMLTHGLYAGINSRIILEVKDPSRYRYEPSYGPEVDWLRKNGYCFEMILPALTLNSASIFENELSRLLNVSFGREKRRTEVLVLYRTSEVDKIKSAGLNNGINAKYTSDGNLRTALINQLIEVMYQAGMPPVVDGTNYDGAIDLDLNIKNWRNLDEVKAALRKYDLGLKPELREIEFFVIKEL